MHAIAIIRLVLNCTVVEIRGSDAIFVIIEIYGEIRLVQLQVIIMETFMFAAKTYRQSQFNFFRFRVSITFVLFVLYPMVIFLRWIHRMLVLVVMPAILS